MSPFLHILLVFALAFSEGGATLLSEELARVNAQLLKINALTSRLAWREATDPGDEDDLKKLKLSEMYADWRRGWCLDLEKGIETGLFTKTSEYRQFYLLCRGPSYTPKQARELTGKLIELRQSYQTKRVCQSDGRCLPMEPDLELLMETSRDPEVLLWAWIEWRNAVGGPSRNIFADVVHIQNEGAKNNGYNDIGECWREELEVDDLEELVDDLYQEMKPLYLAIHAVVRYKLNIIYGSDLVSLEEAIPAHLLGNMWGQNWGKLADLILNEVNVREATEQMKRKNYTAVDLVKRSEDFYISLGFRPMTEKFWEKSEFTKINSSACHPSAANMFSTNDFRMLTCADATEEHFKIVVHEMGHIQYFMEYQHQPTLFRAGTNSAFQEAIGNAIMYGIMTPSHQQRLGLIRDEARTSDTDLRLLLSLALSKIPEIPFSLALEKWRWGAFKGDIRPEKFNEAWWFMRRKYQGLKAPVARNEEFFDPAANFHVSNNTPYIRYFLGSILEMQIFEALCKGAIYGQDRLNESLSIPLHRCDIYGSKDSAKKLRYVMSFGSSINWSDALHTVTGSRTYSTKPLLNYYRPLHKWLIKQIKEYNIPVGW